MSQETDGAIAVKHSTQLNPFAAAARVLALALLCVLAPRASADAYKHDGASRLTTATMFGKSLKYKYDGSGNIIQFNIADFVAANGGGGGGGCFIATAAYGGELDPRIATLRGFRERWLRGNAFGQALIGWYEDVSPPIAEWIAPRPWARAATRFALAPIVLAIESPLLALSTLVAAICGGYVARRRFKERRGLAAALEAGAGAR